mmetsp:Transcript_32995/g.105101  ORF Transcript_32995/g.105101 Transcript_32995/m.105101 type:complete len:119 (-) Transcript_32995:40-396(-)
MEAILQRMRAKQGGGKCPAAKATGAGGGSAKKARPLPVLARTPAADKAADSEHAPWNLDYVLSEDVLSDLTAASEAKQGGEPPEGANPQVNPLYPPPQRLFVRSLDAPPPGGGEESSP